MRDTVALFLDAPWSWVSLGLGGLARTGIDRVQLEASARLIGVVITPAIFNEIRAMEAEALKVWRMKGGG